MDGWATLGLYLRVQKSRSLLRAKYRLQGCQLLLFISFDRINLSLWCTTFLYWGVSLIIGIVSYTEATSYIYDRILSFNEVRNLLNNRAEPFSTISDWLKLLLFECKTLTSRDWQRNKEPASSWFMKKLFLDSLIWITDSKKCFLIHWFESSIQKLCFLILWFETTLKNFWFLVNFLKQK